MQQEASDSNKQTKKGQEEAKEDWKEF